MKLNNVLFILFFVSVISISNAQSTMSDSIYVWSIQKKLRWSDFRANPKIDGEFKAVSDINIEYYTSLNRKKDSLIIHVYCYFNRNRSWVLEKNSNLLKHEQTHFNIAEYYSRIVKEKIFKLKTIKSPTAINDIKKIYTDCLKNYYKEQREYDLQTNYSTDTLKQNIWNGKIDSLLNKYNEFSNRFVKLKIE